MKPRPDLLPSIAVMVAAAIWGLFWLPVRGVEQAGIDALWSGLLIFACGVAVLLPLVMLRWRNLVTSPNPWTSVPGKKVSWYGCPVHC